MKKLKTLYAILGTAAILCSGAVFAEQKFNIPEYDAKDATKKTIITLSGGSTFEKHYLDRNRDGKTDLLECRIYTVRNQKRLEVGRQLYIDDNFDGYIDRALVDEIKTDDAEGIDGIYDFETDFSKYRIIFLE